MDVRAREFHWIGRWQLPDAWVWYGSWNDHFPSVILANWQIDWEILPYNIPIHSRQPSKLILQWDFATTKWTLRRCPSFNCLHAGQNLERQQGASRSIVVGVLCSRFNKTIKME